MSNELAVIENRGIEHYRASTDAASMCKQIVIASAMEIQGKKYVKVEGWQAIAIAHGCVASAGDVEQIEGGIRAVGKVVKMDTGMEISRAEGFVGDDESTWSKRPMYARRAMAQTRAISRACRSAFAHVVVMMNAGLSTTPAEEVPAEGFDAAEQPQRPPIQQPKPKSETKTDHGTTNGNHSGRAISEPQQKRFYAIAKSTGADDIAIKAFLMNGYGIDSSKKITSDIYEDVCEKVLTLGQRESGQDG